MKSNIIEQEDNCVDNTEIYTIDPNSYQYNPYEDRC
jgi:hypothetical protein